ncbi:MAG: hypothetical protein EBR23_14950, partial [Planctomycetia bacterium]|nr:hypothetical protein [Planctomycetia bacterium]
MRAHDPGISTAQGEVSSGVLVLTTGFAPTDIQALLPASFPRHDVWGQAEFEAARPLLLALAPGLWEAVAPGDTVYLRGGTYLMNEGQIAKREQIFAYVTLLDKSGAPGKRITYRAYPGEQPVFDYSAVKPANHRVHAFRVTGSWLH